MCILLFVENPLRHRFYTDSWKIYTLPSLYFFPYKSMYMLLHVAMYHQYLQHFATFGTIHKQYSQLFTVFVWKMTGSHNISVIVNLFVEQCFWKFSCRYKVLCSHRKLSFMWNVKSIHASVRKEEVLDCSVILEGDGFMWSLCFSFFVPPEGDFLFMSRGYLNSDIPLLEKTQMELLYNCTLVYDIDAIVLHTNSNTMGQNHVLHIVFSVSPFFCVKRCLYVSFFAVSRITCICQIKLVCN